VTGGLLDRAGPAERIMDRDVDAGIVGAF